MAELEAVVGLTIALLAAAVVVSVLAERVGIPYVVALLLVAVPVTVPSLPVEFAPALQFVFLPALVFEAAWNVDGRILARRWLPIATLAVPGVALTALLVAGGLALSGLLAFLPALLLGAILAATDPIAVIAVFRRFAVPADLATIVEGESLFNDGAAIVVYGIVVGLLGGGAPPTALGVAWAAVSVAFGGIAVGLVVAGAVALVLRGTEDAPLQVVGTLVAAFGAYLLADQWHLSGIFAAVSVGIAMRASPRFPSPGAVLDVDRFWAVLAFLANALVFVLMGLRIEVERIVHEPVLVLTTLALVTLARVVLAYGLLPLTGGPLARGSRTTVALAIGLPPSIPARAQIVDAVFGVVFITLVVQGLAIGPLLSRLGFARTSDAPA